jgi:hypothetical protein
VCGNTNSIYEAINWPQNSQSWGTKHRSILIFLSMFYYSGAQIKRMQWAWNVARVFERRVL